MNCNRSIAVGMVGALLAGASALAEDNEFRGIWADAWVPGFLDAGQVTQLIADARAYNFNALIVQMRRRGDAFYNNLAAGNDPKTTAIAPSFDALQDIITKAHDTSGGKKRIEVHCWVVTFKIWSDKTAPPPQPGHVFNLHPEYLTQRRSGETCPFVIWPNLTLDMGVPAWHDAATMSGNGNQATEGTP